MKTLLLIAGAYLLASVPYGYLLYYWRYREDIRTKGSGNIGGTNVLREGGFLLGLGTTLLDILKAFLPVLLAVHLLGRGTIGPFWVWGAAVCGHMFSVFLKGKGGKGVASFVGGALALDFPRTLMGIGLFFLVLLPTRFVSLASLTASLALTFLMLHAYGLAAWPAILWTGLVFWKHRENIRRLKAGTERRLFDKKGE